MKHKKTKKKNQTDVFVHFEKHTCRLSLVLILILFNASSKKKNSEVKYHNQIKFSLRRSLCSERKVCVTGTEFTQFNLYFPFALASCTLAVH